MKEDKEKVLDECVILLFKIYHSIGILKDSRFDVDDLDISIFDSGVLDKSIEDLTNLMNELRKNILEL